jgi:hypothetical protein
MPCREMPLPKLTWTLVLTLLGPLAAACGNPCGTPENRLVPLSELPCNMTLADGLWESHPLPPLVSEQCNWLEFRGCSTYEIEHPLGKIPSLVVGYTSFDPNGEYATVASGNSFVVQTASDSTITIRNTQDQLFYLRLVLE